MAAAGNGKKKRNVFFIKGTGTFFITPIGPGDVNSPCPWNPGRSKNRFNKKLKLLQS